MELKDIIDLIDGIGTLGVLILVAYTLSKEKEKIKLELKESQDKRILELKSHNESSESLLEKVLVALQDNQRFLENELNKWKTEIKTDLVSIKEKMKDK